MSNPLFLVRAWLLKRPLLRFLNTVLVGSSNGFSCYANITVFPLQYQVGPMLIPFLNGFFFRTGIPSLSSMYVIARPPRLITAFEVSLDDAGPSPFLISPLDFERRRSLVRRDFSSCVASREVSDFSPVLEGIFFPSLFPFLMLALFFCE